MGPQHLAAASLQEERRPSQRSAPSPYRPVRQVANVLHALAGGSPPGLALPAPLRSSGSHSGAAVKKNNLDRRRKKSSSFGIPYIGGSRHELGSTGRILGCECFVPEPKFQSKEANTCLQNQIAPIRRRRRSRKRPPRPDLLRARPITRPRLRRRSVPACLAASGIIPSLHLWGRFSASNRRRT